MLNLPECMKRKLFILASLFIAVFSCKKGVDVYDGFEKPELSRLWSTDRMVPTAFSVRSEFVRKGNSAARIILKPGDVYEAGVGKGHATERDELRETRRLESTEGKFYQFEFSLFLPENFPIVPTRLVIAQWKQKCNSVPTCSDDSPVLAVRFQSGELFITVTTDDGRKTLFSTREEIRNRWLDFRFRVRFDHNSDGIVDAWLNEKAIISYRGVTCYSSERGYPDKSRFYFKTGLYRDLMTDSMTIYIDEYHKTEISE